MVVKARPRAIMLLVGTYTYKQYLLVGYEAEILFFWLSNNLFEGHEECNSEVRVLRVMGHLRLENFRMFGRASSCVG